MNNESYQHVRVIHWVRPFGRLLVWSQHAGLVAHGFYYNGRRVCIACYSVRQAAYRAPRRAQLNAAQRARKRRSKAAALEATLANVKRA